jgi:hypothetical protein
VTLANYDNNVENYMKRSIIFLDMWIFMIENDINEVLFEKIIKSIPISKLIEESPRVWGKEKN